MQNKVPRAALVGVGLVACATLLLEIALTRIFAVTLWYYFASLAISLALLGATAAAVVCYVWSSRWTGPDCGLHMARFSLAFAVLAPTAVFVHTNLKLPFEVASVSFAAILALQLGLLCLAFFFAGLSISLALVRYSREVSAVYFIDLAGAAIGSLLVVPLLYHVSPLALVLLVSAAASAAAWCFSRTGKMAPALAIACLVLCAVNDRCGVLEILSVKSYGEALQEFEYDKVYEQWSPVSRVAVFAPEKVGPDDEIMKITNDAAAPTRLWRFDGNFHGLKHLENDPRQAAHHLKSHARVLVVGSGGGIDVLTALAFGQRQITAVEINPVIAQLVTGRYADYIGRIFDDPRVTLHVQDARSFVAGSPDAYDVIQITMIDSWSGAAAGAYIFNENSLYTLEAVADYCDHLRPDGILSITRYYDWDEALRLTNLLVDHLARQNLADVHERLMVILENRQQGRRATVLLKNGRFTPAEVASVERLVTQTGSSVLHAPLRTRDQLDRSDYAEHFRTLIGSPKVGREELLRNYRANLTAPTDDCPFFFYTARPADAFRHNPDDHASRRAAIPMLYGTLGACVLVSLLVVLVPICLRGLPASREARFARPWLLTYFACLGGGYMLIEIALVQRLTMLLGHPTYSFVVVLTTLLLSSGLGSLFSGRFSQHPEASHLIRILSIVVLLLGLLLLVYGHIAAAMWLPFGWRVVVTMLLLAPPAFMMGMCFPLGIQLVRRVEERLVPWCWGVNGAFSVLATSAALVLALHLGLKCTIGAGIACYVLAGAAVSRIARTTGSQPGYTTERFVPAMREARRRRLPQVAAIATIFCVCGLLYLRQHERTRFARAAAEHAIVDAGGKLHRSAAGQVQEIDLAACRLDDQGFRRIKPQISAFSGELRRLNLAGTDLTDDGLEHLSGFTHLEELDVSQTQVTGAGIGELQSKLPNCAIRRSDVGSKRF